MTRVALAVLIVASLVGCTSQEATSTAVQVQPSPSESPSESRKDPNMLVTYGRGGSGRTGPDHLWITEDGAFTLWRSAHAGPVGQFGGSLGSNALTALRDEVQAAAAAGPLDDSVRLPGGRSENIAIGDLTVDLPDEDPGGPWAALAGTLRGLLDELTAFPVAAIALEVEGDATARLRHVGADPLRLSLADLAVHVIRFGPGYTRLDEWRSSSPAAGSEVEADDDWTIDLPFDHGLAVEPGQSLQVVVSLSAYRGQAAYPVQLVRPPQL